MKDRAFVALVVGGLAMAFILIGLMVFGKYQLCTKYFSEMNPLACMFTSLPGTPRMNK